MLRRERTSLDRKSRRARERDATACAPKDLRCPAAKATGNGKGRGRGNRVPGLKHGRHFHARLRSEQRTVAEKDAPAGETPEARINAD